MRVHVAHAVVAGGAGQDRATVLDSGRLIAVADGAGGISGGATAAEAVMALVSACSVGSWQSALEELDRRNHEGETTAVIAKLETTRIYGASVGDSQAWVFSPIGDMCLTEKQCRKPLLGSGSASVTPFNIDLAPPYTLIVATDGLFDYVDVSAVKRIALSGAFPSAFVDQARLPNGKLQDDVAVVVVRTEAD